MRPSVRTPPGWHGKGDSPRTETRTSRGDAPPETRGVDGDARPVRRIPNGSVLLGIGLLALAVRLIALVQFRSSDLSGLLLGDASTYDPWARAIASGDWLGHEVFYQAPLYPYLLGAVYAVAGHSLTAVRLVQAVLGSGACMLLALSGRSFFGRRAGLLAGLLLALYPPAIFYDGLLEKTSLTGFLLAALLALVGRLKDRPTRGRAVATGAVLGLLVLARENALILAPILLAWLLWYSRDYPLHRARALLLALALGLMAVLSPVAVRNSVIGGELHLATAQFGPNFFIGNGPQANGTYVPLVAGHGDPSYERADATHLAEQARGRSLTPGQISAYWTGRTVREIAARPGRWIALLARKTALSLNAVEIIDTEDMYTHGEWTPVLRWLSPWLHLGVVLPLALAGVVLTASRRRELILLHALVLGYGLSLVLTYVVGRYRFPLAVLAIPFAAAAVDEVWRSRRRWGGRRWLTAALVAAIAATGANWPLVDRSSYRPITQCNVAHALMRQGAPPERALAHVNDALRADPRCANAHHLRGVLLLNAGSPAEAERELRRAIELEPDRALTYGHLAGLLATEGRRDEAIPLLEKSLALDPYDAEAQNNLAGMLLEADRCAEAIEHVRQAMQLKPEQPEIRCNYGLIQASCGRAEDAEAVFRQFPPHSPLLITTRQRLATIRLRHNQPRRAIEELERLISNEPAALAPQAQLAWILATHADPTVRDGRRALALAQALVPASGGNDPQLLDVLAAAQAETGGFEAARQTASRAATGARQSGLTELAREITQRGELYRRGTPYRQASW